eukprot:scaffold2237_cov175-Ochromonas_danica.AAC.19
MNISLLLCILCLLFLCIQGKKAAGGGGGGSSSFKTSSSMKKNKKDKEDNNREDRHRVGGRRGQRKVIIPVKKEAFSSKVMKSMDVLKEALETTSASARTSLYALNRNLKAYFASDFEALLLDLTTPTASPPDDQDLDRYLATLDCFSPDSDLRDPDNAYRVTLRKLEAKFMEPNQYSALKASFLLHLLLRHVSEEDSEVYHTLILRMLREKKKKGQGRYFHLSQAKWRKEESEDQDFILNYATFVLQRAKAFTGDFRELQAVGRKTNIVDTINVLLEAKACIALAMKCRLGDRPCDSLVTAILQLVYLDLISLVDLFVRKVSFLITENEVSDLFQPLSEEEGSAVLRHLVAFYQDSYEELQDVLREYTDLLELYKMEVSDWQLPNKEALTLPSTSSSTSPDLLSLDELENILKKYSTKSQNPSKKENSKNKKA